MSRSVHLGLVGLLLVGALLIRLPGIAEPSVAQREVGEVTDNTTRAIVVDRELSTPAMYWGWIVGRAWELEYASPPAWIHPGDADYLVVVGLDHFEQSEGLTRFVRDRPVVAETDRFAVFDLRAGTSS